MKIELPLEPIIIKNRDFQTIQVRVLFPFQEEEKDLAKITLLPSMLMYMTKELDTEEKFQKARKNNYILGTNCSKTIIGTTGAFCFNMIIPDTYSLGFDHLEEQFSFLGKMIYEPWVDDNGFNKFELEREKANLKIGLENAMKKLTFYQTIKSLEIIDDENILSRGVENHQEQIDEVNSKNLYDFYLKHIKNNQPIVFVMGNVDKDKINELTKKYLYRTDKDKISFKKNYEHFLKPKNTEVNIVNEKSEFLDSGISFLYKVQDMTKDDFIYLGIVKGLLGSLSSRLLNKKLRDEYDLIYSSRIADYANFGVFTITTYINRDNKDLVIEKVMEVMEELKSIEIITPLLENIKERRRINLIKNLDNKYSILDDCMLSKLEIDLTRKEIYEKIKKITALDVAKFVDRLKLDTIYFVEEK